MGKKNPRATQTSKGTLSKSVHLYRKKDAEIICKVVKEFKIN